MTPERFGELLQRPHLLDGQNATELEELIAAYPWCGTLRVLRYRKAVVSDAGDVDLWRSRAEPFLRHATLHTDEQLLKQSGPAPATVHFAFDQTPTPPLAPAPREAGEDLRGDSTLYTNCIPAAAAAVHTADWYLHRNGLIMEYGRPQPAPIENLASYKRWKKRRSQTSWNDLLMLGLDPPEHKPKRKVGTRPRPTVVEPEVASETLADLLAAQGHTDKAIKMYEQLGLRYPAKSASFAARIQALQQTPA